MAHDSVAAPSHIYMTALSNPSLPPTHHFPATAGQSFLSPSLSVRRCIKSTDWLPLSLPAEAKMQIHATLVGWRPQIYLLQALRVWSHRSSSSPAATWAAGSSGRHGHDCEQYTMRATLCICERSMSTLCLACVSNKERKV